MVNLNRAIATSLQVRPTLRVGNVSQPIAGVRVAIFAAACGT
ncbi:hypothetical protein [Myxosarcina sp. GI1(2024)]